MTSVGFVWAQAEEKYRKPVVENSYQFELSYMIEVMAYNWILQEDRRESMRTGLPGRNFVRNRYIIQQSKTI